MDVNLPFVYVAPSGRMQPPPEDKDPPAYDSMYPGEAQKGQMDMSQRERGSFKDVEGQATRKTSTSDPPEVVVSRGASQTVKTAEREGKKTAAEGTVTRCAEGKKEEEEDRKKDCLPYPGAKEVLQ